MIPWPWNISFYILKKKNEQKNKKQQHRELKQKPHQYALQELLYADWSFFPSFISRGLCWQKVRQT